MLHGVALRSKLRQRIALGTAAGTKTAEKIITGMLPTSASVAGAKAGVLCIA